MIGAVGRSTTPHSVFGLLLLDLASSEFFLSSFEDLQHWLLRTAFLVQRTTLSVPVSEVSMGVCHQGLLVSLCLTIDLSAVHP